MEDIKIKKLLELYKEDCNEYQDQLEYELSSHPFLKIIYDKLQNNVDFLADIEEIVSKIDDMDLPQTQSAILLVIKRHIEQDSDIKVAISRVQEMDLIRYVRELSMNITSKKKKKSKSYIKNLGVDNMIDMEGVDYEYMDEKSLKELRKIIKNFIIYEIYKVINPRRIAGETEEQNIMDNIAMYGVKKAVKMMSDPEKLKSINPKVIKELNRKYSIFSQLCKDIKKGK